MKRVYNNKSGVWKEVKDDVTEFKGIPTNYKELQSLAKSLGIPANQSKEDLTYQIDVVFNS